jgi:hypothetical protein
MKAQLVFLFVCFLFSQTILGDIYLHNPRGSNDRLNEASTNRNNGQRIMDTQNNAKGGYCWGPPMYYYVGSILSIEWTSQHSCNNANSHCEVIIQYMCGDESIRDGTTTDTIPDSSTQYNEMVNPDPLTGENKQVYKYGMNENYEYYQDCKTRYRNMGLYTADVRPGDRARNTRQNPGGTRHGFECPEERDYYPYWHPTPWKDIAVLTNNPERCPFYRNESQNVKGVNYCNLTQYNNQADCVKNQGGWLTSKPFRIPPPDCIESHWSRDNHLGNGKDGYPITYNWTIPDDVSNNCVLRVRYNISTGDYDVWNWNSSMNHPNTPIRNDPSIGYMGRNLTLAFDTRQTGRTFQDRSYVFGIRPRPKNISANAMIYNLNVRGKRGNIVQVYPAVEYDFVPNVLHVNEDDYVHFQWTGCDTNPQGNEGEGTEGTDRSNLVQINDLNDNYPAQYPQNALIEDPELRFTFSHVRQNDSECLSLTQLREKHNNDENQVQRDVKNCAKLNAAEPYFDGGLVQMKNQGIYHYMSTRNNNFSNRSQKGTILVGKVNTAGIVVGLLLVASLAALVAAFAWAKTHPKSRLAHYFKLDSDVSSRQV